MGSCCSSVKDDTLYVQNLKKNYNMQQLAGHYEKGKDPLLDGVLDERPIMGLIGDEKIILIARI